MTFQARPQVDATVGGMRVVIVVASATGRTARMAEAVAAGAKQAGADTLVLRAEGKGFNAGVDIKELQNTEGVDALLDPLTD